MSADAADPRPAPASDPALPEPIASAPAPASEPVAGVETTPASDASPPNPPASGVPEGSLLLRMALGFYGIVALFAFGYALFSGGLRTLFGERVPAVPGLLGGIGIGVALVLLSRVGARAWPPMRRMSEALADVLGPVSRTHAALLALLSGVAEELLFRGALWPHLGLVGTTLLFGLVHVLPRRALWLYPLFAVLAGLLFGLLREGTQSLWPCILAHVTVNGLNLTWIGRIAARRDAPAA